MDNQSKREYKGTLTRDELRENIDEYWDKKILRRHDKSKDLAEAIAIVLNKHGTLAQIQLLRRLYKEGYDHLEPTRWSVDSQLKRLEDAGLIVFVIESGRNTRYMSEYEIIDNSFQQQFFLNEEIRLIKHLSTSMWDMKDVYQRDRDYGLTLERKATKIKKSLLNIKEYLNIEKIDQIMPEINKLISLYRHSDTSREFEIKEHTLFTEFYMLLKPLLIELEAINVQK